MVRMWELFVIYQIVLMPGLGTIENPHLKFEVSMSWKEGSNYEIFSGLYFTYSYVLGSIKEVNSYSKCLAQFLNTPQARHRKPLPIIYEEESTSVNQ